MALTNRSTSVGSGVAVGNGHQDSTASNPAAAAAAGRSVTASSGNRIDRLAAQRMVASFHIVESWFRIVGSGAMENNFPVAELNQLGTDRLARLFEQCVAVDRWARDLADSRPYAGLDALLTRADELSAGLTDEEIGHALGDHPRIGERVAPGTMSATEQSGVDSVSLAGRLLAANLAYERRF